MSHYYPRHFSGLDMPILRRNNCTNTASGILALELSERSYIKLVQGLLYKVYFTRTTQQSGTTKHAEQGS